MLKRRRGRLPEEAGPDADRLLALRKELTRRIKAISRGGFGVVKTRHHGDYHLGQVLVVGNDFQIIDFEGEPARPLQERRRLASPLQDVAGMLRSFDYAAFSPLVLGEDPDTPGPTPEELARFEGPAAAWIEANRRAFLDGYLAVGGDAAQAGDAELLLRAFELDKAVYEVMYEARHRPPWLQIPLGGIRRLLGASP
jgi:maltose alpha-D-glucosyltransferase/alpha-amylase